MQTDAARVIELEKEELAQIKAGEEAVAREQAQAMFDEVKFRQQLLSEHDRIIRVKGIDADRAASFENAGILFVEDLAALASLADVAEKTGLSPEQLDELVYASNVYLSKEREGTSLEPSSADAGPEDGYEPSVLLNPEPLEAEMNEEEAGA